MIDQSKKQIKKDKRVHGHKSCVCIKLQQVS